MSDPTKFEWCVLSRGVVYIAYGEKDAMMVQATIGGDIYWEGRKYR